MSRKLFCEYGPICYALSVRKECLRRDLKDTCASTPFAHTRMEMLLPTIVKGHTSPILRKLDGVDMSLQNSKAVNLALAAQKIDRLILHSGEQFSFWRTIGSCTRRKGYQMGLTLSQGHCDKSIGGGLCQLANLIHYMVLHSPLLVTELHHHTDAMFPDSERRVPFGTGTSVFYNYVDYRFANNTDRDVQLHIWIDDGILCGELRAESPFPERYRLIEEDHHFSRQGEDYYRNSRIYRLVLDRETGNQLRKELILVNHSRVLYNPALIPVDQLREEVSC